MFSTFVLLALAGSPGARSAGGHEIQDTYQSFKVLEGQDPDLAWERLKLWFKNNGNIQHEKLPWDEIRVFKDALLADLADPVSGREEGGVEEEEEEEAWTVEEAEEAWREFERSVEEGDREVWEGLREFYKQIQREPGTEDEEVELGADGDVQGNSDENGERIGEQEAREGKKEPEQAAEETELQGEGQIEDLEYEEAIVEPPEEQDVASEEAADEGVCEGDQGNSAGCLHNQPAEQQVNTAAIQEAMEALSRTLLAKMSALEGENEALRVALGQVESGVAADMRSLVQDLEAVKEQVELVKEQISELPPPTVEQVGGSVTDTEAVQELINNSLQKYAADYVGMPDYALESSGAVVFTIGETEPYTRDTPWMGVFGISIWRSCKTPRLAIQKDNSPGNCWSFTGDKGALTIQLSAQVFPEHFTLDHIPIALAPNQNASSAPYHFRVLGLDYGNAPKGHVLGNYEFTEFPIQTFPVQQNPYEKYFRFIKVEILSNHGNRDYTCLYRFRVHGKPYDTQTFNG